MSVRPLRAWIPWLFAPLMLLLVAAQSVWAAAADLPRDSDALVRMIRTAIEARDYDSLDRLVLWEGAGEIKRRIVRFELNRNLGRPIQSISFEPFPEGGMDGVLATGKLAPNMEVTNRVRVIFAEPAIETTGRPPASVFLVGLHDGAFRIALVTRAVRDDDGD